MRQTAYFYRKIFSTDFIKYAAEQKIVPVKVKNFCNSRKLYFDSEKSEWLNACRNIEDEENFSFSEEMAGGISVEFVEKPVAQIVFYFRILIKICFL